LPTTALRPPAGLEARIPTAPWLIEAAPLG